MSRSVSTDLELDPGKYSVLMKITAKRNSRRPTPDHVLRKNCKYKQEKLVQIGLAYDLAHARGQVKETEEEKKRRLEQQEKAKAALRQKRLDTAKEIKRKDWLHFKRQRDREMRHQKKEAEYKLKKAEAAEAAQVAEDYKKFQAEQMQAEEQEEQQGPQAASDQPGEIQTPDGTPLDAPAAESPSAAASMPSLASMPDQQQTAQDKIDQFNQDLRTIPSVRINSTTFVPRAGSTAADAPPASTAPPPTVDDPLDTYSVHSFDSSIDSLLDLETFPDTPLDAAEAPRHRNGDEDSESEDENAQFAHDPWNAVCVVGLRVFSKDKGVSVAVVRPKVGEEEEDTPLDVDDPNKAFIEEAAPEGEEGLVEAVGQKVEVEGVKS